MFSRHPVEGFHPLVDRRIFPSSACTPPPIDGDLLAPRPRPSPSGAPGSTARPPGLLVLDAVAVAPPASARPPWVVPLKTSWSPWNVVLLRTRGSSAGAVSLITFRASGNAVQLDTTGPPACVGLGAPPAPSAVMIRTLPGPLGASRTRPQSPPTTS